MVITMNKIKANNWTDAQWFNFICGIIRSDNFSGNSVEPPEPSGSKGKVLIIKDHVFIERTNMK